MENRDDCMSESKHEPIKTETTTAYFDMEGNQVEDESKAVRFWIREIDPNTKKVIHEQHGYIWDNFPDVKDKEDDTDENVEDTEPGI